jgi:phenylpyruvate tautomerase PptA (4-oxalocrotonate tautomerase family)
MNNREWLELLSNEQINEIIDRDILEAQTIPCDKMPVIIYVTEVITAYRTFTGEDLSSELSDEQLAKALAEPCCDFCVKGLTDNDKKSIVDEATNLFMEWLGTEHNSVSSNIMNWLTKHLGTEVDAGHYWNWVWLGYDWSASVLKDYEPDWAYIEQLEKY